MAYTNVSNYETPWTIWGGAINPERINIGNVKLGPKGIQCPEHHQVMPKNLTYHIRTKPSLKKKQINYSNFQTLYFFEPGFYYGGMNDSRGAVKLKCGANDLPEGYM